LLDFGWLPIFFRSTILRSAKAEDNQPLSPSWCA
jgi:hypothetical protein